jgi:hypothetical protein
MIILITLLCLLVTVLVTINTYLIITRLRSPQQAPPRGATATTPQAPLFNLYRNLKPEEIPKNLQEVKILEARQLQNGVTVKISSPKITVKEPGEKVRVDLLTDAAPHKDQQETSPPQKNTL